MTNAAARAGQAQRLSLAPTIFEKVLAAAAALLLARVCVAMVRGASQWSRVPAIVWLHLATIVLALALTPYLLLRPRGIRRHRQIGYVWVAAMTTTAALSFGVRNGSGQMSAIHILSAVTVVTAPLVAWTAHKHDVRSHRATVLSLVTGALIVAGFFTFPFGRLLGRWLFG